MSEEIRIEPETVAAGTKKPRSEATTKMIARRAELKRQKRKTHRHRINASNRLG